MTQDTLSAQISRALEQIDAAIAEAGQRLDQAPDNPAVKRLTPGGGAFVMSLKNLGASWSAFDHDWKAQYRFVRQLLEERRFAAVRELLKGNAVQDAKIGRERLAPEVIEKVLAIVGDLPKA